MVLAIPGGRSLFSALQRALRRTTGRIRLSQAVHDEFDDWCWLTRDFHSRLTSWDDLVEKTPTNVGSHDAARYGMGGVWFGNNTIDQPTTLWQQAFSQGITMPMVIYQKKPTQYNFQLRFEASRSGCTQQHASKPCKY